MELSMPGLGIVGELGLALERGRPLPPAPSLNTTGEISRRLRVPVHRVEYIIATRGIQPAAVAGASRVFDEQAVAAIARELNV